MDINTVIHPVSGGDQTYKPLIKAPNTQAAVTTTQDAAPIIPVAHTDSELAQLPDRYREVIAQLSASLKDFYALGDTQFTIFKDASGQYITRYTSLRDGTVTYVP